MKFPFLLLGLLCLGCASLPRPYFYEIEKDGHKSYVLGTAHAGFGAQELPAFVREKFDAATGFASEVSPQMGDQSEKQFINQIVQSERAQMASNAKAHFKISGRLSPEAWAYVKKVMTGHVKSEEALEAMTPFLLYTSVRAYDRQLIYLPYDQAYGLSHEKMDFQLYDKAKAKSKVIVRLDSEEALSHECRDDYYIQNIEKYVRQTSAEVSRQVKLFYDIYKSGDEQALAGFVRDGASSGIIACVLDERNKRWVDIVDRVQSVHNPLFVAVGAGHVVGDGSLMELLKTRGYNVRRMIAK